MSYTHGMIIGQKFGARKWSIEVGGFIWFLEHLRTIDKNQSRQSPKDSIFFVKPHFIMIYHLKCCARKIRVWQTYPPYKNLVLEIPKLGVERNTKTGPGVVFTSSYCFFFRVVLPLTLEYLMVWLRVWRSAWSRLLKGFLRWSGWAGGRWLGDWCPYQWSG